MRESVPCVMFCAVSDTASVVRMSEARSGAVLFSAMSPKACSEMFPPVMGLPGREPMPA